MGRSESQGRAGPRPKRRARDMPPPREQGSAMGPLMRTGFSWVYRGLLAGLYRTGARAWQLTVLSVALNAVAGWLLVTDRYLIAGLLLIPAGLLDVLDGGIARLRGTAGRAGAFLDAVSDRISDSVVFGSLAWSLLGQDRRLEGGLALVALIVALLVSHIRAEGEAAGLTLGEGLFQRLERYIALIAGLVIPGALLPVLAGLAGLGAFTVAQRVAAVWTRLAHVGPTAADASDGTTPGRQEE